MSVGFKRFALSGLIILILGLQAFVGLTYHGYTRWPFISYPMYSTARYQGDRITDYSLKVAYQDGDVVDIEADRLEIPFWLLRKNIILPVIEEAFDNPASLRPICQAVDNPQAVARLEIYDIGLTVERNGPSYGEPIRVGSVDMSCEA